MNFSLSYFDDNTRGAPVIGDSGGRFAIPWERLFKTNRMELRIDNSRVTHNGEQVGTVEGDSIHLDDAKIRAVLLSIATGNLEDFAAKLKQQYDRDDEIRKEKERNDNNLERVIDSLEEETGRLYQENRTLRQKLDATENI